METVVQEDTEVAYWEIELSTPRTDSSSLAGASRRVQAPGLETVWQGLGKEEPESRDEREGWLLL